MLIFDDIIGKIKFFQSIEIPSDQFLCMDASEKITGNV